MHPQIIQIINVVSYPKFVDRIDIVDNATQVTNDLKNNYNAD